MADIPRILCVDDEENILKSIQRSLRKHLDIHIATSGKDGLEILRTKGPFQVVISDMKMPEMNGAEFLRQAREVSPETVRLLLTGYAELNTVVAAINQGHIFRFMTKPCSTEELLDGINAALTQYDLQTAEKVLLEQTLKGSISALIEVLSLASPEAFGRATNICHLASGLANEVEMENTWQVEMAAMLSQIGMVILPESTVGKVYRGEVLSEQEQAMVERVPAINQDVLGNIPRLDPILEIFEYQTKNYNGRGKPLNPVEGKGIPLGARILKVAVRTEELQNLGYTLTEILKDLRASAGVYDPDILKILSRVVDMSDRDLKVRGVTLKQLETGMMLMKEVRATSGLLLVTAGQEVSVSLLERIQNYDNTVGVMMPLWIEVPDVEGRNDTLPEGVATETPEAQLS